MKKLEEVLSRASLLPNSSSDPSKGYKFTCVYGKLRGPFSVDQLKWLEVENVIKTDTMIVTE